MTFRVLAALAAVLIGTAGCAQQETPGTGSPRIVADYTNLVLFDWDSAELTPRARRLLAETVGRVRRRDERFRFEVLGHADRSGPPTYNQRLSERRAEAVAAELQRMGVPRSLMTIRGYGESRNLVPTVDGVREPQNRRVEIQDR